jgi:DNA adenine methylase
MTLPSPLMGLQSPFTTPLIETQSILKPPLKWAGGKRWLVPRMLNLWQPYQYCRLIEPFVGGMSVTLGLSPKLALLNDVNPHVINFYRHLQQGLEVTIAMKNDRDLYYQMRSRLNQLTRNGQTDTSESAQIFYYLNRTGFNGLCRFNNRGEFNVPFGRYQTINYCQDFMPYRGLLRSWQFTCGDFANLQLRADDFIYADPPYDVEFTKYSKDDFTWDDQVRLTQYLAEHPGKVVLSNQATDRILDLYQTYGFAIDIVDAPRRISCNGDRTPAREVIAWRGF